MDNFNCQYIMSHLDAPFKWFWFTLDELVTILLAFLFGCLYGSMLLAVLSSGFFCFALKKIKAIIGSNGSLQKASYWYVGIAKQLPDVTIKEYII